MGGGRWDASDWTTYASTKSHDTKTTEEIFESSLHEDLDPRMIKLRESRDSEDKDHSTPVIVALDVTGSMGSVLDVMARTGLNTLVTEIYERKPVSDPHIMCMGVGDVAARDEAPLQCTQFEADIRIAEQLEKLYLEYGGGGNHYESYILPWYFAALKTSSDAFEKRGKKGYLFTIGDEEPTPEVTAEQLEKVFGHKVQRGYTSEELLDLVSKQWEVFHIMVEEGSYYRYAKDKVVKGWTELLGQRAIKLSDHTKLAEVIVSTIQVCEGHNVDEVTSSWDGDTSLVVKRAVSDLTETTVEEEKGVVNL